MSDLHFEFDGTAFKQQVNMLDPSGVDVLVLAGDICAVRQFHDVMTAVCKRFEGADVIWVHGNHEYYGFSRRDVVESTLSVVKQNKNLHWLDQSSVIIKGQRFIGATMWFKEDAESHLFENRLYDFSMITELKSWVYDVNEQSCRFFHDNVKADDVVITHHLPTMKSIAPTYKGSALNRFFMSDMSDLITSIKPKLWIHGHTHTTMNYEHDVDGTRIVCNPRGYYPDDINVDFDNSFTITI